MLGVSQSRVRQLILAKRLKARKLGRDLVIKRTEAERFRRFTYDELQARDKVNLDIFWLKDESLEDTENLPPPEEIAAEIVEALEAALEEFRGVAEELNSSR